MDRWIAASVFVLVGVVDPTDHKAQQAYDLCGGGSQHVASLSSRYFHHKVTDAFVPYCHQDCITFDLRYDLLRKSQTT